MGELVLLVVAAAWAAVLVPPLLRSRVENRPNSSIIDFRRQLNKLQGSVPNRATGSMRGMARPLAQSPMQRVGVGARHNVQHTDLRHGGTRSHTDRTSASTMTREFAAPRRAHGDPTGGQTRRPEQRESELRQSQVARPSAATSEHIRRRRSNVLFTMVIFTASSLFLAATTKEPSMLYIFAISFLALCAYVYMLAQVRQRESSAWPTNWMNHR